jgi:hypothetical protein
MACSARCTGALRILKSRFSGFSQLFLAFSPGQPGVKQDAGERFPVKNRSLFDHFEHVRQLHKPKFDL